MAFGFTDRMVRFSVEVAQAGLPAHSVGSFILGVEMNSDKIYLACNRYVLLLFFSAMHQCPLWPERVAYGRYLSLFAEFSLFYLIIRQQLTSVKIRRLELDDSNESIASCAVAEHRPQNLSTSRTKISKDTIQPTRRTTKQNNDDVGFTHATMSSVFNNSVGEKNKPLLKFNPIG